MIIIPAHVELFTASSTLVALCHLLIEDLKKKYFASVYTANIKMFHAGKDWDACVRINY